MNEKELNDTLAKLPRLQPRARLALRLVFVEGCSNAEAARQVAAKTKESLSTAAVRQWVERVKSLAKDSNGCPADWQVLHVCLPCPSAAWDAALKIERDELKKIGIRRRDRRK